MSLFSIDDDLKAFLKRANASLDRVDRVAAEAEALLREAREALAAVRRGLGTERVAVADESK